MSKLRTLGSLVDTLSERGARPAVLALHREGVERWSYGELVDHARRLACGMERAGVDRGDHVALFAGNRVEWILACLGLIGAGAVVVPLDAQIGDEMLGHALADSGARLVFTTTEGADRLGRLDLESAPEPILLDAGEDDERGWRRLLAHQDVESRLEPGPEDRAALFYTSGTTGTAKEVPLTHRNLTFQLDTLLRAGLVTEDDRVMLPLPLHHAHRSRPGCRSSCPTPSRDPRSSAPCGRGKSLWSSASRDCTTRSTRGLKTAPSLGGGSPRGCSRPASG